MIFIGSQLAKEFGAGTAICSILMGNLILWIVAISIITMSIQDRSNAIENVQNYLGKYGALFMGIILIGAFISWYVLQINTSIPTITHYFAIENKGIIVRIGAGLGFLIALLSVGGIKWIKWLTIVCLPFEFIYYLYAITRSDFSVSTIDSWGISLSATITAIFILLPGVVNMPTFFRHGHSRADCYLALTLMTLLISFFEISTIWMQFADSTSIIFLDSKSSVFSIATIGFIILTLICTNLLNIYFASACWEYFVPRFEGAKGYAIIGLIGTATYTFIQIYSPIRFLEDLANYYIACIGIVLLIASLVRTIVRHRPREFEKEINGFCWLIGCVIATIVRLRNIHEEIDPVLVGSISTALAFLCIFFIEEIVWSIKKLKSIR